MAGQYGEQFALPDAVQPLRAVRRAQDEPEVAISVADPLSLVGIISPGAKIPACAGRRILFQRGLPVAVSEGDGRLRSLIGSTDSLSPSDRDRFPRQIVPPIVRAYLRRPP